MLNQSSSKIVPELATTWLQPQKQQFVENVWLLRPESLNLFALSHPTNSTIIGSELSGT